jgi:hypothetical protein
MPAGLSLICNRCNGGRRGQRERTTAPLLVSLFRVAIVLAGGWMLQQQAAQPDWLYYLVAGSTVIGALTLGIVFAFRPPNRRVLMLSG